MHDGFKPKKRKFLTLDDKIKLIAFKNENNGVVIQETAEIFGVEKTQVSCIPHEKEKLMNLWETNTTANIKRYIIDDFKAPSGWLEKYMEMPLQ